MVPDGMTSHVHSFDAVRTARSRTPSTYGQPSSTGKTTAEADTFHGRFVRLVPDTEVVQAVEFETDDPALQGEMTIAYILADADGGTDLVGVHEGLPPGVPPADNELGWTISLEKLAALVERSTAPQVFRSFRLPPRRRFDELIVARQRYRDLSSELLHFPCRGRGVFRQARSVHTGYAPCRGSSAASSSRLVVPVFAIAR